MHFNANEELSVLDCGNNSLAEREGHITLDRERERKLKEKKRWRGLSFKHLVHTVRKILQIYKYFLLYIWHIFF